MAEHAHTTRRDDPHAGTAGGRRSLLAAIGPAAAVLAGVDVTVAVQAAPNPDAELIAHCAAFDALERSYLATDFAADDHTPAGDAAEAERESIYAAQESIVNAICASPPRTLAGAAAVAHSLALWDAELLKKGGEGHCTDDRLLVALVRGLTGRAAA